VQADRPTHGYNGPIKVSSGGYKLDVAQEFIDVGKVYHKRPYADDTDDLETCNMYSVRAFPTPPVITNGSFTLALVKVSSHP